MAVSDEAFARMRDERDEALERVRQLESALTETMAFPPDWALTRYETALLSALYRSAPNPLPMARGAALFEALGSEDARVEQLRVYVCRLRKKVGPIQNVWGVGYRLTDETLSRVQTGLMATAKAVA
jgi:DNA-binding response OmpR family regulator